LTAVALVLSQGGPLFAVLTCLATVLVAAFAGTWSAKLLDRVLALRRAAIAKTPPMVEDPYSF
jgi:hypothetical protein